ncbi:Ser/Thr protein kinase RdoA involved in Cpx stress response, MazF antagonist [Chitinophaga filiformis]|uniref:Ser/Thr protein kinase RdoA involved in Cpx stress response, MazF antagonist n=2 Tax=Chitinophaga filiformis TaxID=104663 RepID=A0A1G7GR55_CHIFI|nr:Ser/Thr protein kinase RdoA involved in Cpx stress response, MazF antagonist [Chitinophaga filiformis]
MFEASQSYQPAMQGILTAYGLVMDECSIQPFGSGLINATWKVSHADKNYILQRINHQVFKKPALIAQNISAIGQYLDKYHPDYFFVQPVQTIDKQDMVITPEGEYFRLQPFVANSRSYDVVNNEQLAYEAARQFGRFTRLLSGMNIDEIQVTLPDFHNLTLRYAQFEQAVKQGNAARIAEAREDINTIRRYNHLTDIFTAIRHSPYFKVRVMHHDTKISNVLFDADNKGICVIDLDTVMPGYFISDFGDMMRTYLSPVSEEETDLSKVQVRKEYYTAIMNGYLSEMKDELSVTERAHLVYAGQFMVYMQAIRFLTDYFNNDIYYGARYEQHNLLRARNQLTLLESITQQEQTLSSVATH